MSESEKKNRRVGLLVAGGIHLALLLLCFFLLAWQPPDPPVPEYGVELALGFDNAGSGSVRTPSRATPAERPAPQPAKAGEPAPAATPAPPAPVAAPTPAPEPVQTYDTDNPVSAPPDPKPVPRPEPKPEVKKPDPKPTPAPTPTPEAKPEPKKPEPKPLAEYPGTSDRKPTNQPGAGGTSGSGDRPSGSNSGDQPGTTGQQGSPEGKVDAKALYGTPGGGGGGSGSSLDMAGWVWDFKPTPRDQSSESGRIVFEVKIDDQGEILSIRTVERTVSPTVAKVYEDEVRRLTFSKTRGNTQAAPTSTGRITFILRSR